MEGLVSMIAFGMCLSYRSSHMSNPVVRRITVTSGGHIEVDSPELQPGTQAEVIVIPDANGTAVGLLENLVGAAPGTYGSPAEADAYLNRLRDEWHS
jgi:hypothetical protein